MQWFNKRTAVIIIISVIIITFLMGYGSSKETFDYDFEKFFPPSDTETEYYEQFRKDFENDYDFMFIGLKSRSGIYDTSFLQKVNRLTDTLLTLKNVQQINSITNIKLPVMVGGGLGYNKLVHFHNDSLLKIDSIKHNQTHELRGSFISEDQKTTCLFLQTKPQLAKHASDTLLSKIENIVQYFQFDEVHIAGKIKAQKVYLDKMQKDTLLFLGLATVLVILLLAITFRSITNVVIPLILVVISVIWELGLMYYTGKKIDILMVLLPTIMFIVGMSDIIHFISKYMEELRNGAQKKAAIVKTIKDIGIATFLTSFTTALGFLSLITSNILPVKEFGIYNAIAVIIAFLIAITLLPSIFLLLPIPKQVSNVKANNFWNKVLHKQLRWIFSNKKKILIFSGLMVISCISGLVFLKVDNLLLEDLSNKEPLKKDIAFFETQFSGGRPFEMTVTSKTPGNILSFESLREIQKLEEIATQEFQLGFLRSPVTLLKTFNRSINSGLNAYYNLPETQEKHDKLMQQIKILGFLENEEIKKFLSDDLTRCRISGKMHDLGSYKVRKMEKSFLQKTQNFTNIEYRLTGSARLIDENVSYLSLNIMQGLGFAVLIVSIAFGLIYRSLKIVIIALIPNIIPMLMIAGIMGFSGIDIKISTSIIFTIAFGIAVDDTIHFLSRFKIEQRNGSSIIYAIKRSFLSTGKAMILTSVILCAGFITMISSSFSSLFYIGFLLSLTLFIALLADLYLLPILLLTIKNKPVKTKLK
jgi:predicted RND superfamily exporter protein